MDTWHDAKEHVYKAEAVTVD